MHYLDYLVIGLYLAGIVWVGFRAGKHQSRQEFFLAGGSMGWFVVGISVMATLFSSNSFVFYPSAAFGNGLRIGMSLVAFALATFVVVKVFIPVYKRLGVSTAYEYLERRYHVSVRTLASALFVLLRIGWMASATYAASLVLASVTKFDQTQIIVVLGAVSILYTLMGGLRAVMWTDVIQFFIFSATILASVWIIMGKSGMGFGELFGNYFKGREGLVVDFEMSLTLKYGTWALLIGVFLEALSAYGVDQVVVQRYLSSKSEESCKVGAWVNLAGSWLVVPGLLMIGIALYSWYSQHPGELGTGSSVAELVGKDTKAADRAMPDFVRLHFPPGLAGLFVAALIAAIMSSIDSGIHSVTTALVVDFRDRLFPNWRPDNDAAELLSIRLLLVVVGILAVALACSVGEMGDVFTIGKKLTSAFGGPLLAIFLLALFSKRSTWQGVLLSVTVSTAITLYLMYAMTEWFAVWFWPVGFGLALASGWLASFLFPAKESGLGYGEIMREPRMNTNGHEQGKICTWEN